MKKIALAAAAIALIGADAPKPASEGIDRSTLHIQVILDKLGFAPGVLDGKGGQSLEDALSGFQTAYGLDVTGKADAATLKALSKWRVWRPTKTLVLDAAALAGPYTAPFPKEPEGQAALKSLDYRNALEALAERFHTTPATLIALNSPQTRLVPGARIVFPNALPLSRDYANKDAVWVARLNALNVTAETREAARIVVDKSERVLRVYDAADKLIAQFPATMGSARDPLPIGRWTVKGVSFNPEWQYNPEILKTADKSNPKMRIPPGPNNPVGVVWIDLSKEHYGIHGTAEPSQIGRAESNGCIRLTNWDVARLSQMVKSGVPAVFQP